MHSISSWFHYVNPVFVAFAHLLEGRDQTLILLEAKGGRGLIDWLIGWLIDWLIDGLLISLDACGNLGYQWIPLLVWKWIIGLEVGNSLNYLFGRVGGSKKSR